MALVLRGWELHARETAPPRAEAGQLGEQRGGVGQDTREAWWCKPLGAPRTLARVVLATGAESCYAYVSFLGCHTYFSVEQR